MSTVKHRGRAVSRMVARAVGPRIASRLMWLVAGCLGAWPLLGWSAAPSPALAQSLNYRAPDAVPASWTRYAQLVQYRFGQWLSADDAVAYRFHLFLENRVVADDAPPAMLVVQAWIDKDGNVARVVFPPLKDQQADADLHTILVRGNIGEPPPPDLLQPLHLRVSLSMPG
jgi:hypothetical protein